MGKKHGIGSLIFYIIVISIVLSFFLIRYFGNKYGKNIIKFGVAEARRLTTVVINNSISSLLSDNNFTYQLFDIDKDDNGNIKNIDIDTHISSLFIDSINKKIEKNLNIFNNGNIRNLDIDLNNLSEIDYEKIKKGVVYYIPFGSLMGNGLLSNVGPLIPIKLVLIGDVITNLDSNIREYGINNAMIEIDVSVNVELLVNLLFVTRNIKVNVKRPIIMKIIQGNIPDYYLRSNGLHN